MYLQTQKKHSRKKSGKTAEGAIFRLFIILFSLSEILIDSMRYDASHLFFPGRILADLNKGAGFMGLSQLLGAIICLVLMISYTVKTEKKPAKNEKRIKPVVKLVIFVAGTTIGGSFEYFVQRNSSRWVVLYLVMICGIAIMMFSLVSAWREAE